jgi:apolipoprotein N-acyltransferase
MTVPGDLASFRPFELPSRDGKTYRFASPICFEDTLADAVRDLVRDPADGSKRVDFLVNLSNDGWFEGSAEVDMHQAIACFRAVENRVGLVRSTNTGISAFIDPSGRVGTKVLVDGRDRLVAGWATDHVLVDSRVTPYTRWGDWLAWLCLAATVTGLAAGLWRKSANPA